MTIVEAEAIACPINLDGALEGVLTAFVICFIVACIAAVRITHWRSKWKGRTRRVRK